jgi:hypothetical protein
MGRPGMPRRDVAGLAAVGRSVMNRIFPIGTDRDAELLSTGIEQARPEPYTF